MNQECRAGLHTRLVDQLPPGVDPCPPTVIRPGDRTRAWGHCPACGWAGPLRSGSDQNTAIEDACDHAFPGWRDMPVVSGRPYDPEGRGGPRMTEWERACRRAYPPGWFDREGPVREERYGIGSRIWRGAPGGGWLMPVMRPGNPPGALFDTRTGRPLPEREAAAQEPLFE